jgi:hypothetical protein
MGFGVIGAEGINISFLFAIQLQSQLDVINLAFEQDISNIAIIGFCPGLTNMKFPNKRQAPFVGSNAK